MWNNRSLRELVLTYFTFRHYKRTVKYLDEHREIMKAGAFPNDTELNDWGCIVWFNFFWLRSSYVRRLVEPERTDNRYYYEKWIAMLADGRQERSKDVCYSLYSKSVRGYDPSEASEKLRLYRKLYKYIWPVSLLLKSMKLRS